MGISANEQYVVNEKGNPTAVILPIESYKKILAILSEVEDHKETKILSQSEEFKKGKWGHYVAFDPPHFPGVSQSLPDCSRIMNVNPKFLNGD